MKRLILIPIVFLFITLISCEGNTKREWTISNESQLMMVIISNPDFDDEQTYFLAPGTSIEIASTESRGGQKDAGETAQYFKNLFW